MRVSWAADPPPEALAKAQEALTEIEALRARQPGPIKAAEMFSTWLDAHYWLAGRLFEAGRPADLEEAFAVAAARLRPCSAGEGGAPGTQPSLTPAAGNDVRLRTPRGGAEHSLGAGHLASARTIVEADCRAPAGLLAGGRRQRGGGS